MDSATGAKVSPEIVAVPYTIDPAKSRFTVRAFATGLLSGLGHNPIIGIRDFSGRISFTPDNLTDTFMNFTVKADSLAVQNDVSDKDRREIERIMKADVLQVQQFPDVEFETRQVSGMRMGETLYVAKVEGDLSLHGVTRRQTITAQVIPGDDSVRAYGEFVLKQTDFNIKLVSVAGGALKVKDELKFSFDIVARK
ncbi:MAG: YceI family protein [Acidobacteriota bacterium]|nr:YceI family protein [Acidobacteriota bacterium]